MNDLTSGLLVVAGTGLIVGLIFFLVARHNRKREAALRNLASLNGWAFEPISERLTKGIRLRKGEWMIESITTTTSAPSSDSGSSNVSSLTRWFSDAARMPDGIVLIGLRQPEIGLGNISTFLVQAALGMVIGDEAKNAEGIQPVELGSLDLMNRFMVWTNREEAAKKLLDQSVENALINLPKTLQPVVKYSPSGLEVKFVGVRLYKEEDLYALVKLGAALLDSASA